ncbi:MAG: Tol-Pal system protein TolB, partial [Sulfurimicrobium sp.]|nr:Tol-Pal system protein TolB [Sulfurimicrobium sp.]
MKCNIKWMLMLCWLALAAPVHAALTIEITGGAGNQIPVAIVPFAAENTQSQSISGIISADLTRSG